MICPICKGGKTLLKKEQGKGCYEVVLGICDKCHGTGEIEMTNEEYIHSLTTEQLAKFLRQIYRDGRDDYVGEWYEQTEGDFAEWLKEIHHG